MKYSNFPFFYLHYNNHLNIQQCENDGKIKILCKPVFNEYFSNQETNKSEKNIINKKYIIVFILVIIIIILLNLFHI